MPTFLFTENIAELADPDQLADAIGEGLEPIQYRSGEHEADPARAIKVGNTAIYAVRTMPDIVLRHNGDYYTFPDLVRTADSYNQLPQHGIPSIPYVPIEYAGQPYVATRRVTGESLPRALTTTPAASLMQKVDTNWKNLAAFYHGNLRTGFQGPGDISHYAQYMHGRTAVDPAQELHMVDLGEPMLVAPTYQKIDFLVDMLWLAHYVVEIEDISGADLPDARDLIRTVTTDVSSPTTNIQRKFIDAVRRSLDENISLEPSDIDPDEFRYR